MRRWRLLLFPVLLAVLVSVRGQDDFSLGDALLEGSTKKPLITQKTPSSDLDDFDLVHALGPDDPKPPPPTNPRDTDNPKRDHPKGSDTFSDFDLLDGNLPRGGSDGSGGNERKDPTPKSGQENEASQGAIAGIVSAVAATVIGAVSSFIAYQKKKLCFKQSADEENVNMESHRGAQSEPPGDLADGTGNWLQESVDRTGGNGVVQRTLLEN